MNQNSTFSLMSFIGLLSLSNLFMTFAWYGHLKSHKNSPLVWVILISYGIAFFEYCIQVPANRIGSEILTLTQMKMIQEVISILMFAGFSVYYMKTKITSNSFIAFCFLILALFFALKDHAQQPSSF